MLDMIKPQHRDCVTLGDLKRCRMTHVFFDTFFNLEKYLDHEQRDPFASHRDEYVSERREEQLTVNWTIFNININFIITFLSLLFRLRIGIALLPTNMNC